MLARAARHGARLALVAGLTGPDTAVTRRPVLDHGAVRLSAVQWDLVTHADGATPRGLAWLLGRSVTPTTLEVSRLIRLGALELLPAPPPYQSADRQPQHA